MELSEKLVNVFKWFLMFAKGSILDIWLSPEYASVSIEKQMVSCIERDGKNCASFFNGIITSKYNTHFGDYSKM